MDYKILNNNGKIITDESCVQKVYDQIYDLFCEEIAKGTICIVIDNTNLSEWEYIRFLRKA